MSDLKTRAGLVLLEGILALTAILGAITVIPNLPHDWIKGGVFPDYTIPALALGVLVGGSAVIAGRFTLVTYGAGQPQSWLQVAYITVGAAITILGARLWLALGGRIPLIYAGGSTAGSKVFGQ
jgi:uncharacterized membrane protein